VLEGAVNADARRGVEGAVNADARRKNVTKLSGKSRGPIACETASVRTSRMHVAESE
jgi:hypothetical protein